MIRHGLFGFGPINYAVPLLQLRKIVHNVPGYLLPKVPVAVAEVLVDEGQLIPLLELPGSAEVSELSARDAEYKVFAVSEGGTVAFPAGQTNGIIADNKGELLISLEHQSPGVLGIFKFHGQEYNILDIDFLAIGLTQNF